MSHPYRELILETVRSSETPLRPNQIVVEIARANAPLKLSDACIIRDVIDSLMVRGELVYNETYSGLCLPATSKS